MAIELGLCNEGINTQFAPLAALSAHYQCNHRLQPLTQISKSVQERNFSLTSKLIQVLLSMLIGCDTLYEVNSRLRQEQELAKVWG